MNIYSYNKFSNGAAELARALGIKRIRHDSKTFRGRQSKLVINWGSTELPPEVAKCRIVNHPGNIRLVSNKLAFFRAMTDAKKGTLPRVVPWTDTKEEAQKWLKEGLVVVARTVLTGSSGSGIVIVGGRDNPVQELPKAQLYTQYVPKSHEFRVHFVKGQQIDAQRKIRDPDREPTDWKVRSHANGFIFVRGGFELPKDVVQQSLLAFTASGLDFGAVDVIYSDKHNKAYVLEINSAPGLENTTIESYAQAFRKVLK